MCARAPGASSRYRCKIGARSSGSTSTRRTGSWRPWLEDRLPAGLPDVGHPARALPEHRYEVAFAPVVRDHNRKRPKSTGAAATHLECLHPVRRQPGRCGSPRHPVQEPGHPIRAAPSVHPPIKLARHRQRSIRGGGRLGTVTLVDLDPASAAPTADRGPRIGSQEYRFAWKQRFDAALLFLARRRSRRSRSRRSRVVPGERLSGGDPDACLPTGAEALLNVREFSDAPGHVP
jgi:hypothetical protein